MSSRMYYLRSNSLPEFSADINDPSPDTLADEVLTEGTTISSSSTSSIARRFSSPYFRGYTAGPILNPAYTTSLQAPNISTPEAVGGDTTRDVRDNRITSSQDGLHNRDEEEGALHFRDAQENQDFAQDAQEFNMNLEGDYSYALQKINNHDLLI